jgi:hypothetical protein
LDRIGDNLTEINSTQSGAGSIGQLATSPFSVFNDKKGAYLDKSAGALEEGLEAGAMTLSITSFSITTLSIKGLHVILSIGVLPLCQVSLC